MHDPFIRGLASDGKVKKRSDEGTRSFVARVHVPGGVFSGFQYPTPPLEPLNGIRLAAILDGTEDLGEVFTRVAASSRLVMDVAPGEEDG
jgi:hypothetical protein